MKLSDYAVDFLAKRGVKHAFVVQGGAIAHMIDSVGRHPSMTYICPAHEQAAAMAVDGYVRTTGGIGCAMATTGPGVVNLMTGIACLYYDSLPAIFIGGQVSTFRLHTKVPGVRQLGFQESPHVDLVRPITKYAVLVDDPQRIRYELEKALHIAQSGRPGPVFVDICDDVQRAEINPATLPAYTPPANDEDRGDPAMDSKLDQALGMLAEAKRPVLVIGAAVRIAGCIDKALRLVDRLDVPVGLTWAMSDMMDWNHPLNIGGFGISATRRGNFAVQNADFILSIGSRLDTHATGTPINTFARGARKVIVDIAAPELEKFKDMNVDVAIRSDVRQFFSALDRKWNQIRVKDMSEWKGRVADWQKRYPSCLPEHTKQKKGVNPYHFLDLLADETASNEIIIPDCGANLIQTFQGYRVRQGQRLFSAFNNSPMGYSLSGAIGACLANNSKPVVCITGDGGLQVNMQELGTVMRYKLPIKIFLFNNHGYGIIQQTQEDWMGGRYHGSRPETGLMDPDYMKIARAFGMKTINATSHRGLREKIRETLKSKGPVLCNLDFSDRQRIFPMLKAGRPIEDPKPLLKRKEFLENMIEAPLPVSLAMD